MSFDDDGYPTVGTLKMIGICAGMPEVHKRLPELIQYIRAHWWHPDIGIEYDEKTGILEFHTLGWSGNEDIIDKIIHSWFDYLYWAKSERGGHYTYELFVFGEDGSRKILTRKELFGDD